MNKGFRQFVLILSFLLMCITPVFAYVEVVEQDDSYFVTDEAKVLDSATEEYIVSKNQILNETSGAAIVVVTVDLLNADITDYAYTIFNEWGLGDETINNGILLLVSTGDQDYYCMIGRGLESLMSIDELQKILDDDLEPDFAAGNYQQGIRKVFDTLYQQCVHLYNVDENASNVQNTQMPVISAVSSAMNFLGTIMAVFVVITVLVILFTVSFRRRVVFHRPYRPVTPPPVYPNPTHRPVYTHRPSYPSSGRTVNRPVHTSSRSGGFGSSGSRSFSSRSSSFSPRSGGSTRGAGAGRRR